MTSPFDTDRGLVRALCEVLGHRWYTGALVAPPRTRWCLRCARWEAHDAQERGEGMGNPYRYVGFKHPSPDHTRGEYNAAARRYADAAERGDLDNLARIENGY